MPKLELTYLRAPCFVEGEELRHAHGARQRLSPSRAAAIRHVLAGGATKESTLACLEESERAEADFSAVDGLIGVVEVDVQDDLDVVMVEQGYGGVYVHSVELLRHLKGRWRCLLLSPVDPLFEPEPVDGTVTLDQLRRGTPGLDYFAWVQVVRSVTILARPRLLLIMHRSQSLYLFDLLGRQRTVIYCDGFYDAMFKRVSDFRIEDTPRTHERVLQEIHYLAANSTGSYMGLHGDPGVNLHQLTAGAFSLEHAVENWCWGAEQRALFVQAFPDHRDTVKLMLPFTDPGLFDLESVDRQRRVLFTTTMHNIDRKGLPELCRAMARLRAVEADVVVRQPEHLPAIPPGVRARMNQRALPKPEMVQLYHRAWLNFRVSRDESSPMSILESMVCEVPQIVSPMVARQIPLIEDGATGFVVDPDDTDRAVWALRTLLADERLRDRMGRECRRRALELAFERRVEHFERLIA